MLSASPSAAFATQTHRLDVRIRQRQREWAKEPDARILYRVELDTNESATCGDIRV
jgi:hypothetical protein